MRPEGGGSWLTRLTGAPRRIDLPLSATAAPHVDDERNPFRVESLGHGGQQALIPILFAHKGDIASVEGSPLEQHLGLGVRVFLIQALEGSAYVRAKLRI